MDPSTAAARSLHLEPVGPLLGLGRQLRRRLFGTMAALTGHGLATMLPVVPFLGAAIAVAAIDPSETGKATSAALVLLAMAVFAVVLVVWRPLVDAGLVRALRAELDDDAPLGLLSALEHAWSEPLRNVGARLLVDLLLQATSLLALPFLTVPVRVAAGEPVADAFTSVLRDLGHRPGWHLGVWSLFLVALVPIVFCPPLLGALPVAYAVHAERSMRVDGDLRTGRTTLLWVLVGVLALVNVADLLLALPLGAVGVAAAVQGDPAALGLGVLLGLRGLVGWALLAWATFVAVRGHPRAARSLGLLVVGVAVLSSLIGFFVGCCFLWPLAGVVGAALLVVPIDDPGA